MRETPPSNRGRDPAFDDAVSTAGDAAGGLADGWVMIADADADADADAGEGRDESAGWVAAPAWQATPRVAPTTIATRRAAVVIRSRP